MASLSYGRTATGAYAPLNVDATGKLVLAADVTVQLSEGNDSVAVYGSDGANTHQLKTNTAGQIEAVAVGYDGSTYRAAKVNSSARAEVALTAYDGAAERLVVCNEAGILGSLPFVTPSGGGNAAPALGDSDGRLFVSVFGSDGSSPKALLTTTAGVLQTASGKSASKAVDGQSVSAESTFNSSAFDCIGTTLQVLVSATTACTVHLEVTADSGSTWFEVPLSSRTLTANDKEMISVSNLFPSARITVTTAAGENPTVNAWQSSA